MTYSLFFIGVVDAHDEYKKKTATAAKKIVAAARDSLRLVSMCSRVYGTFFPFSTSTFTIYCNENTAFVGQ